MKNITVRGRTFTGIVVSTKMAKTATVEWEYRTYLQKYERYEKQRSRVKAHNEMNAKKGDIVEIKECRPLSKTKNFVITKIIGQERLFLEREARLEESKKAPVEKKKKIVEEEEAE